MGAGYAGGMCSKYLVYLYGNVLNQDKTLYNGRGLEQHDTGGLSAEGKEKDVKFRMEVSQMDRI